MFAFIEKNTNQCELHLSVTPFGVVIIFVVTNTNRPMRVNLGTVLVMFSVSMGGPKLR